MAEEKKTGEQPIIIKKIVKGGHGHHGGAWKVAYADFVTAMMAFFIVMWILSSSTETKESVSAYFDDPGAFMFQKGKHTIPIDLGMRPRPGNKTGNYTGEGQGKSKFTKLGESEAEEMGEYAAKFIEQAIEDSVAAAERLDDTKERMISEMQQLGEISEDLKNAVQSVKISNIDEGLRVELIESDDNLFFTVGSATLRNEITDILKILAEEIGKLPNYIEIEGHTDGRSYSKNASYTNFELSADRANSARRIMKQYGLWDGQIVKVTGFADKMLRYKSNPFDKRNRRISLIIKNLTVKELTPKMYEE